MAFSFRKPVWCIFLLCMCFSGCFLQKEPEPIVCDNTEPLALIPHVKWAVIKDSYSAFHAEANWESKVNSYCRSGEICRILGNRTTVNASGVSEVWLKVEKGWIPENAVSVCYNLYNAKSVSEKLMQ